MDNKFVTVCTTDYFDSLLILVKSLREYSNQLCVINIDLHAQQVNTLKTYGVECRSVLNKHVISAKKYKCLLWMYVKSHVNEYQLSENIIWFDSDVWIQDIVRFREIFLPQFTDTVSFSCCPVFDFIYPKSAQEVYKTRRNLFYQSLFQCDVPVDVLDINSGVFFAKNDSSIFPDWQKRYEVVHTPKYAQVFEELCLECAIAYAQESVQFFSSEFNWLPDYRAPVFDDNSGLFLNPIDHTPLSIIHNILGGCNTYYRLQTLNGSAIEIKILPDFVDRI